MKHIGKSLVVLNDGVTYSPETGLRPITVYRGTPSSVSSVAAQLAQIGAPFTVRADGMLYELETRVDPAVSDSNSLTGHWEIDGRPEQVSIFQHPKYLALSDKERGAIQQLHNGKIQYTPEQMAGGKTLDEIGSVTLTGNALEFYRMVYNGQLHFARVSYIARHFMVASTRRDSAISGSNIGRIYTSEQLKSEALEYADGMHKIFNQEIAAVQPYGPPVAGYVWGWLKQAPTVRIIAGDRVECAVEYWFDNWPTMLYSPL